MDLLNNDWFLLASAVWVMPWKGWALWRASRRDSKVWFVALLVVNTFALLEIIYIFFGDAMADKYNKWRAKPAHKHDAVK